MFKNERYGFTLIELSVVILIIGLLIGGITAGASLIKQAQLRAIMSDLSTYQVAYNNFKARYDKKPGDFNTASLFWASTTAGDPNSCAVTDATRCNGNGNNVIEHGTTIATNESLKAWRHLYMAKMISSGVDQLSTSDGSIAVGDQAPASKRSGVGYMIAGSGVTSTTTIEETGFLNTPFGTARTNAIWVGASTDQSNYSGSPNLAAALTPEEAFNVDQKMDDGKESLANGFTGAWTGGIRSITALTVGLAPNNCNDIVGGVHVYQISFTERSCTLGMALE